MADICCCKLGFDFANWNDYLMIEESGLVFDNELRSFSILFIVSPTPPVVVVAWVVLIISLFGSEVLIA